LLSLPRRSHSFPYSPIQSTNSAVFDSHILSPPTPISSRRATLPSFLPHSMFNFHVTPCPKCRTTPRTISYSPSAPAVVAFCILLISHNILYLFDLLLFRDLFSFAPSHIFYSLRTFFSVSPTCLRAYFPASISFRFRTYQYCPQIILHISVLLSLNVPLTLRSLILRFSCTSHPFSFFLILHSFLHTALPLTSLIRPSYFCLILHFAASPYFQIPPRTPPSSSSFPLTFSPSA
jgi:hypothetical protein